ncbi:MAG: pilus assembly protein N-terminal domain-containing protein, partial [Gemmatimonadota bacterium]|nr:pilus assembly protein N-terminal domain-containing protein [Gemmatimonadota bacterium]
AAQEVGVTSLDIIVGRSYPVSTPATISKVSVANPEVADVVVITNREVVINGMAAGETDVILWQETGARLHYRVQVRSGAQRRQIVVGIRFAEVRRDALRELGVSGVYRRGGTRVGTGIFRSDQNIEGSEVQIPGGSRFLSVLTDFDTDRLLAFLDLEETRGRARILAEPSVMAGDGQQATFLAGGELPIPIAQGGTQGEGARISIQYKEFGVRLTFTGNIVSDSLVKLHVLPEVSSLDFGNAIVISGFRVPAFRTRRIETTVDVRGSQSLIISGMFNEEQERVRTGVPGLMELPILGALFSSTRWQRSESELLVVVTPEIFDPSRPRARDLLPIVPDTSTPAREAIEKRLPQPPGSSPPRRP